MIKTNSCNERFFVCVMFTASSDCDDEFLNTPDSIEFDLLSKEIEEIVSWEKRKLKVLDVRDVVRENREEEKEEEEDREKKGENEAVVMKRYVDCLCSFKGLAGDEVRLMKKIAKYLRNKQRNRKAGIEIDVLCSAPCRFPFLKGDERYDYANCANVRERFYESGILFSDNDGRAAASMVNRVDSFKEKAEKRIEVILDALKRNHGDTISVGNSVFAFKEIGSRGKYRFDALFDKSEEKELFQFAKFEAPWTQHVQSVLLPRDVDSIDINISIVWTEPGCADQEWHSDGAHRDFQERFDEETGELVKKHSSPYAVCVFMSLVDLDDTVGYTEFWPESHKTAGLLGFGCAAKILGGVVSSKNTRIGDWVMYDYRLIHRGIGNRSDSTRRPILQFLYAVDGYIERKNYGTVSVF
jgi:hypothetical protein